jgi:hypothetical protein
MKIKNCLTNVKLINKAITILFLLHSRGPELDEWKWHQKPKKRKRKNPKTIKVVSSLDVAVQNAWQLHRLHGGKLDYFTFRRQIVLALLQTNKSSRKRGRPSSVENIISRFDNTACYTVPQEKQSLPQKNVPSVMLPLTWIVL